MCICVHTYMYMQINHLPVPTVTCNTSRRNKCGYIAVMNQLGSFPLASSQDVGKGVLLSGRVYVYTYMYNINISHIRITYI